MTSKEMKNVVKFSKSYWGLISYKGYYKKCKFSLGQKAGRKI
jgi:hypothetical protein